MNSTDAIQASTTLTKGWFLVLVAIWAIVDGLILVTSGRSGQPFMAAAAALLASPVPIGLLAQFYEAPRVGETRTLGYILSHWQDQSYAFLFGDTIFLPFAAAMAALAWRQTPALRDSWAASWQWTAASAVLGIAAGFVFRHINDAKVYLPQAAGSFNAPTKLFHDWGTYPVLFGGLVCVGIPLIVKVVDTQVPFIHLWVASPYLGLMLSGVILWAGAGAWHDMGRFGHAPLVPQNLHPDKWVWPQGRWPWSRWL